MSRTRTRVSRGLIAILVVTIVLGLVFYFHNTSQSEATETRADASVSTPAPITTASPAPASPLQTSASSVEARAGNAQAQIAQAPPITAPTVTAPAPAPKPNPLADGKAKMDAGELLEARRIINAALVSNQFSPADAEKAKHLLREINQDVVFSPRKFADDEYGGSYTVATGELLQKIAASHDVTWQLLCRLNGLSDPRRLRAGANIKVLKGPLHAVVSKKKFTMDIYFNAPGGPDSVYVTTFPVGLGKDDSTPTGTWVVERGQKIPNPVYYSPRGEGIIDADDPKNPLGEHWIGLTGIDGHAVGKQSYGIHGTIEPDSIGKMESMGCIRLRNEDVAWVFDLLVEGKSTVIVKD